MRFGKSKWLALIEATKRALKTETDPVLIERLRINLTVFSDAIETRVSYPGMWKFSKAVS